MDDRYLSAAAVVRDVLVELAESQLRYDKYNIPFGMSEADILRLFRERCDLYKHKYDRSECIDVIKSYVSDATLVADDTEGMTLFRFSADGSNLESWMKNAHTMVSDQRLINFVIDRGGIEHVCSDLQRNLRLISFAVDRGGVEQVCKDLQRIELSLRRRVDLPCYMGKRYQDYFRSFLGPNDGAVEAISEEAPASETPQRPTTTSRQSRRKNKRVRVDGKALDVPVTHHKIKKQKTMKSDPKRKCL